MSEDIDYKVADGLATITLNRPKVMNAMTHNMWGRLLEILQEIEHDPDAKCILLQGAGANFCSGQDVTEFAKLSELTPRQLAIELQRAVDRTNPIFLLMERMPQPIVASVRGVIAGGGMSILTVADLIVASETASFIVAQIKLGAIPDASLAFNLRRAIGIKKAKQYCLLGDRFDAPTAADMGLVNWVVPDEQLEAKSDEIVRRLVGTAPVALSRTKSLLNRSFNNSLAEHVSEESVEVGLCVKAPEFMENVRRFSNRKNG